LRGTQVEQRAHRRHEVVAEREQVGVVVLPPRLRAWSPDEQIASSRRFLSCGLKPTSAAPGAGLPVDQSAKRLGKRLFEGPQA